MAIMSGPHSTAHRRHDTTPATAAPRTPRSPLGAIGGSFAHRHSRRLLLLLPADKLQQDGFGKVGQAGKHLLWKRKRGRR